MPSSASATADLYTLSLHDALPILHRLAIHACESRPQDLVPPDDLVDAALKRGQVQRPFEAKGRRHVEGCRRRLCLIDEPEPLLTERSEEHTSELQSRFDLVCRLLLPPPQTSTLFPYTTLFRSCIGWPSTLAKVVRKTSCRLTTSLMLR